MLLPRGCAEPARLEAGARAALARLLYGSPALRPRPVLGAGVVTGC
jgi:hypothetical protein